MLDIYIVLANNRQVVPTMYRIDAYVEDLVTTLIYKIQSAVSNSLHAKTVLKILLT